MSAIASLPFDLDDEAIAWVESTYRRLTDSERVAQLLLPLLRNDADENAMKEVAGSGVGGLYRFANASREFLLNSARVLGEAASIPLLMAADLEFEEISAIGGIEVGTRYPNQLAVAATGATSAADRMATVAAVEGIASGFNWSFTPVVDISQNFLNPLVPTRSFGDDPERIAQLVSTYVSSMESLGMATTVKHFPGDGVDDRDQHTVTSKNSLSMDEWRQTYGRVMRAAIGAGTRTIMAGHISLPAYVRSQGGGNSEAYLPATLSPTLLNGLLRGELGFRGLIVSDASEMGGFAAVGRRSDIVAACIESGCDILLFNEAGDHELLLNALEDGRLSHHRLKAACSTVLAFKASLGLHKGPARTSVLDDETRATHAGWANDVAKSAVTLVRDKHGALPISPSTHRRILLAIERDRGNIIRKLPELEIGEMLTDIGFDVEVFSPDTVVDPSRHDALIYVLATESKQGRIHARVDWNRLQPGFPNYMHRYFQEVPCILLSFGSPYHAYDAPLCPIIINAYSPVRSVQEAAVAAIVGRQEFIGTSPVNAFAGLDEGELDTDQTISNWSGTRSK